MLRVYVIKGAVVYVELEVNPKKSSNYVMSEGYIVADKSKLRQSMYAESSASGSGNEKLKQEDIDKLITKLIG